MESTVFYINVAFILQKHLFPWNISELQSSCQLMKTLNHF